jgi:hypothetical protein
MGTTANGNTAARMATRQVHRQRKKWFPWATPKRRGSKLRREIKGQVVLLTRAGEIIPIIPDWRRRAFLSGRTAAKSARRSCGQQSQGSTVVKLLSIYIHEEGVRNITDYWCDVTRLCEIKL